MKIDLHCHTKKIKSGDPVTRNVTSDFFAQKISDANVELVGITNHNVFDLVQYRELTQAVKDSCMVWPGVELDVRGNSGKRWHLIVIGDSENAQEFSDTLNTLINGASPEQCLLDLQSVVDAFSSLDILYIPHFHHKTPSIPLEDSEQLESIVGDNARILNETADIRTLGVFANHNYKVIIGSDVRDWNEYEKCTFSELRLPIESFHQLYMLSKRDQLIVQTLLNKNQSRDITVQPFNNVYLDLKIYNEVNLIFGPKGTGKTEILKSMQKELEKVGISCAFYTGSENEQDFNKLTANGNMIPDLQKVGVRDCGELFESFKSWEDISPTPFSSYLSWNKTKDHNANKKRLQITNATTIGEVSGRKYQQLKDDVENFSTLNKSIEKIELNDYLVSADERELKAILKRLGSSISEKFYEELVKVQAAYLTDFSLKQIKIIADKNTNTLSRPSTTGFKEFADNRLRLKEAVDTIIENTTQKEHSEIKYVGSLDDKGKIYIKSLYRMYTASKSRTEEFRTGIQQLAKVNTLLSKISKEYYQASVFSTVSDLCSALRISQINSADHFLGLSKIVVNEKGNEYKPSNGERAILMMQHVLGEDKAAYLFDEPELGMGNSYIDSTIRPQISSLGKSKKIVVVATHNANIAVRTLPYTTILRDHDNGEYKTYSGNPFINTLTNIIDLKDKKNWKEQSMLILEGGPQAFYERKEIYESRNS